MRDYIKFGGNLMEVSGILSGVAIYVSGSSTHMNVEEVGAPPWLPRHGRGLPPSPYKRHPLPRLISHLLAKDLSPPFRIPPWSRISEIHVPSGFSGRICCFRCFTRARAR